MPLLFAIGVGRVARGPTADNLADTFAFIGNATDVRNTNRLVERAFDHSRRVMEN